jgi:hypothetical protein
MNVVSGVAAKVVSPQMVGVNSNVTLDLLKQKCQMKDPVISGGSSGVSVWEVDDILEGNVQQSSG